MLTNRKHRSDRKHIVYRVSFGNQFYIGVTVVEHGRVSYSLKRRWQKHVCRAKRQHLHWKLCEMIRKYGGAAFNLSVIKVVRGKSAAHQEERELIHKLNPSLNTDIRTAA